jgi:hypothetical protein
MKVGPADVAVTYSLERAKIAPSNCGCFWLNGAGANVGVGLYKGLGVAADFTGEHASNIQPGVNLGKISFTAGPRYTFDLPAMKGRSTRVFGEALFGVAHAFDSVFPAPSGSVPTANSFSIQMGVGFDVALAPRFALRLPEVDYIKTGLPNNGSNSQNDLRIAFGVSYRIGK